MSMNERAPPLRLGDQTKTKASKASYCRPNINKQAEKAHVGREQKPPELTQE